MVVEEALLEMEGEEDENNPAPVLDAVAELEEAVTVVLVVEDVIG